jgi:hypothetical protein
MSECEDAKAILRMLLAYPSNIGKKELGRLHISAWQLLATESPDLEKIAQIIKRLRGGRQRGRGRKIGSIARNTSLPDQMVFQEIDKGVTLKEAITKVYGDEGSYNYVEGFEAHERRITRRKQEMKFLSARRGDIK